MSLTQDEIIRMAQEAGFTDIEAKALEYFYQAAFAAGAAHGREKQVDISALPIIIEAAVKEAVLAEREKQEEQKPVAWVSEDVCDGQFINGKKRRLWWECIEGVGTPFYAAPVSIEAAVLAEREACAKVCDEQFQKYGCVADKCAAAIRARSNT